MNRAYENEESSRQHESLSRRVGTTSHEEEVEELYSFVEPSGEVFEELKPVSPSEANTCLTSMGPMTSSRTDFSANVPDGSEDKLLDFFIYDVLQSLPENKHHSFSILMKMFAIDISKYQRPQERRYREIYPLHRSQNITIDNPEMGQDIIGTLGQRSPPASQRNLESRCCSSCKITMKKSIFYQHRYLIRKYGRCDVFTLKIFPCVFSGCHERLSALEKLCEHMFQVHGVATDIKRGIFDHESQFFDFICWMENRGGNFRFIRGSDSVKKGIVQFFRCNGVRLKGITQLVDPLVAKTVKKPLARTEQICTAFIKKTYCADGTIEVKYCDHHLHDHEKPHLFERILNRVYDMIGKKLPFPLIVMILHAERNQLCVPGTALERRILTITPEELRLVAETAKLDLNADANSGGELTEAESKMLQAYERNRNTIRARFQLLEREAERKRMYRERVHAKIDSLCRAMMEIEFFNFDCDLLVRLDHDLQAVVELWNTGMESGCRFDSARHNRMCRICSDITRGSCSGDNVNKMRPQQLQPLPSESNAVERNANY